MRKSEEKNKRGEKEDDNAEEEEEEEERLEIHTAAMYDRWASRMHRLAVPLLIGTAAMRRMAMFARARTYTCMCVRVNAHIRINFHVCASCALTYAYHS